MKELTKRLNEAQEALQLELYVSLLLSSVCEKDESVVSCYPPNEVPLDIELKNGLRKLEIPNDFYVEVKKNLMFDTFSRVYQQAIIAKERKPELKGVLIVYQQAKIPESIIEQYTKEISIKLQLEIRVISLDDLREKIVEQNGIIPDERKVGEPENGDETHWKTKRNQIINAAKEAIHSNNITLFLGAGVSADAGMASWDKLLKYLVNQKGGSAITKRDIKSIKDVNFNSSLIIGRYIKSADSTLDIPKSIQKILYNKVHQSNLIDSICGFIASGSVESVITYNYDMLIENVMAQMYPSSPPKVASVFDSNRIEKNQIPVYHVHGIIPDPSTGTLLTPDIVLTEDSYHKLYSNSYDWSNIEQLHALDRNVCFFIGLSMSDPNLRRLLDFSYAKQAKDKPLHYVFLKRNKFGSPHKKVSEKDKENWRILEIMLSQLGLNVIWFDDFPELPILISQFH